MSLLKEFAGVPYQQKPDLKKSDSSDAGKSDVTGKVRQNDVSFSLMRNTINSAGEVTGSDVANYLERAAELNDEVDTVPFGLETGPDGDIVKVYVKAEEADKFEEALKKLLGMEDDIELAINELAQEFDIVDVVWPKDKSEGADQSTDVTSEFDSLDTIDDDDMEEIARYDALPESLNTFEVSDEPTSAEQETYHKLSSIVSNLKSMGTSGVSAVTTFESKTNTKYEMIAKYVQMKYAAEVELLSNFYDRLGTSKDDQPFWLN